MAPDKTHPSEGKDVKIDVVSAAEQEALLLKKGGGDSKQSEKALNVAKANEMSFWLFRWITKVRGMEGLGMCMELIVLLFAEYEYDAYSSTPYMCPS